MRTEFGRQVAHIEQGSPIQPYLILEDPDAAVYINIFFLEGKKFKIKWISLLSHIQK